MDGNGLMNNFTIYLLLIVCVILVTVDVIEIYRILLTWENINHIDPKIFNTCIKWELIIKTTFSFFSFFAACSALILTSCFALIVESFEKFVPTFIRMNYFFFGPLMLGFCILGLYNWTDTVFYCDTKSLINNEKYFSFSSAFSLLTCFIFALFITVGVSAYESVNLYMNSVLRREEGSKILRQAFWWVVLRVRNPNESLQERAQQNHENQV